MRRDITQAAWAGSYRLDLAGRLRLDKSAATSVSATADGHPYGDLPEAACRGDRRRGARGAARSGETVTRRFYVGDERHHGFYLLPVERLEDQVTPDFLDDEILQLFVREFRNDKLGANLGRTLLCECTGVEWSFRSTPRFMVRQAELRWVD